MFYVSFCKCSLWVPNVFILTVHPVTLVSVYHSTSLPDGISVLGFNKKVFDSTASLEVHLYAMFAADVFIAFTLTLDVWHHYVRFVDVVGSIVSGAGSPVGLVGFDVGLVQSPTRIQQLLERELKHLQEVLTKCR